MKRFIDLHPYIRGYIKDVKDQILATSGVFLSFYPRYPTNNKSYLRLKEPQFVRLVIVLHLIHGRTTSHPFRRACFSPLLHWPSCITLLLQRECIASALRNLSLHPILQVLLHEPFEDEGYPPLYESAYGPYCLSYIFIII